MLLVLLVLGLGSPKVKSVSCQDKRHCTVMFDKTPSGKNVTYTMVLKDGSKIPVILRKGAKSINVGVGQEIVSVGGVVTK
jgi:hypothetical protein